MAQEAGTMNQEIAHIAIVVKDYDEAIAFYTQKLHFVLIEDTILSPEKRWVMFKPSGTGHCCLLLALSTMVLLMTAMGCLQQD